MKHCGSHRLHLWTAYIWVDTQEGPRRVKTCRRCETKIYAKSRNN